MQTLLRNIGGRAATEISELEQRNRELQQEKRLLTKQIKNKKTRDARLMRRAAKDLTSEQLVQVAALKTSSAAKAKAKCTAAAPSTHGLRLNSFAPSSDLLVCSQAHQDEAVAQWRSCVF